MNIIVFGGSRGLGLSLVKGLCGGDENRIWVVSRSQPEQIEDRDNVVWIKADLCDPLSSINMVREVIRNQPIDLFLYNAGIWESRSFENETPSYLVDIINVNLTSLILALQGLLPNLIESNRAKIVLISSTAGLENEGSRKIAYVGSKFGVRGVAHAAREFLRDYNIAVTCISPGSIAADISIEVGAEKAIDAHQGKRIPVSDILAILKAILSLSSASCPKEIVIPAMRDKDC